MTAAVLLDRSCSILLCFAAAVLHELGHIIMLVRFRSPPRTIRLTLFDIAIADRNKSLRDSKRELAVILAGPAVNLVFAGLSFALCRLSGTELLSLFGTAHLALGVFNSLPVCTLDGGQALLILLSMHFPPQKADRILTAVSLAFLFPTAVLGFLLLLKTRYNFTLLLASLWLIFVVLRSA